MTAGSDRIEIAYLIEGVPADREFHFGVEMNFAGLPDGQDDRFYRGSDGQPLGQLGEQIDLQSVRHLGLTDGWLGLDLDLETDTDCGFWGYPVQSVSQSEAGFEMIHQAVSVQPHWRVCGDKDGRWSTKIFLSLATQRQNSFDHSNEVATAR